MSDFRDQDWGAEATGSDTIGVALVPILRHFLTHDDLALFTEEVVARVRGMLQSLAQQLLRRQAEAADTPEGEAYVDARLDRLVARLLDHSDLLAHLHALAQEWQLTDRLRARNRLDVALVPILEEALSGGDAEARNLARAALAAQSRFMDDVRRMELPLEELPGDLFHVALMALRGLAEAEQDDLELASASAAQALLRAHFDEGQSRIGLQARLLTGLETGALGSLELNKAGVGIFLTALAMNSASGRAQAVLLTNARYAGHLVLVLRAAGLTLEAVHSQLLVLFPDRPLPAEVQHLEMRLSNPVFR